MSEHRSEERSEFSDERSREEGTGMSDRDELLSLIKELAVVHGRVTLSSGQQADYYIDLRRITLHRRAAPLVGRVLRHLTADWSYDAAGGLTLGADPVGTAILHASDGAVDAFVVRKAEKQHGMQQRIEGPSVAGRRVLAVEDVSTTGSSPLTAVEALREAGADVVGVALIVDRGARQTIEAAGLPCRAAYSLADLGLA
jgi:orotate phosphoribosyltransferase